MRLPGIVDVRLAHRARISLEAVAAVRGLTPAVVITGGSKGIGLALAKRFAKAGKPVAIVARGAEALSAAADEIATATGQRPLTIPLDITVEDAGAQIDKALSTADLYLDILVNCAGMGLSGRFAEQETADIERLITLNISTLTRLTHHALGSMSPRGRGGIINVASFAGLVPGPYQAMYYASKAFVISLSQSLAQEETGTGVRITAVAPGPVDTGFHADMGAENALYRRLPLSMSADAVAASIYRGYSMGHRLIVPGILNRALAAVIGVFPYAVIAPAMSWLLWPGEGAASEAEPDKSGPR